ncbi:MAG: DUF899 family protein [Xanthomonadales bacterium]|nr:DUF899 family protein [Xanthomonadales bacterium]
MVSEIVDIERQIFELNQKLNELRRESEGEEVRNYEFDTLEGQTTLLELFGGRDRLLLIHNMGQGCRYCTLWADGFNGFVPHLESAMALALVSKDAPELQRRFANSRGWRFRLASHGGGDYIREQSVMAGENNMPGAVLYERREDRVFRKNSCIFGPGDLYCPAWQFLAMAGLGVEDWTPQYRYWGRPQKMDDGGQNLED